MDETDQNGLKFRLRWKVVFSFSTINFDCFVLNEMYPITSLAFHCCILQTYTDDKYVIFLEWNHELTSQFHYKMMGSPQYYVYRYTTNPPQNNHTCQSILTQYNFKEKWVKQRDFLSPSKTNYMEAFNIGSNQTRSTLVELIRR